MRISVISYVVATAGCAVGSSTTVDYDRLAPIIGASVATPGHGGELGALEDATSIARGGLPKGFDPGDGLVTGSHDGVRYAYAVFCQNLDGGSMKCSPSTGRAFAFVQWDSPALHRTGMWQLEHLQDETATAIGASALSHDRDGYRITDNRAESFRLDFADDRREHAELVHGQIDARLRVVSGDDEIDVTAAIALDGSRSAMLTLDGRSYMLDLDTGTTGPVIIVR